MNHKIRAADRNVQARFDPPQEQAQLAAQDIDAVFLTGGSVRLVHVRSAIVQGAPAAQVIEGDTFGAVGKGLTIEATRRFGSAATPASATRRVAEVGDRN
jgi:hypothetical chaperone protein